MGIRLSNERYEEIKMQVVDMFTENDISCVPISGFEIAQKMGVKIIPYSAFNIEKRKLLLKKSEDGFSVEKTENEWYIFYNDEKDYGRINHTMLHEIGHIVLDHTEESDLAETEVKFFAKYALAPPVLVHKFDISNPMQLANFFEISYEAACYAYSYYKKWLQYGSFEYTEYEERTLRLFAQAN